MAKLLKLRRGTTTQHGSFTGAEGEVTVDTDKETLVVHDGLTAGGHPVAAEDMANVTAANIKGRLGSTLTNTEINSSAAIGLSKLATGALPSGITIAAANIVQGTITNGQINSGAAIAGTKVSPDFGSQSIVTTGNILINGDSTGTSNHRLTFGSQSGGDLAIYHDGSHSRISDEGTGSLLIQSNGGNIQLNKGTSENMLVANTDGSVELYYDSSKKFETTSGGVDVTGNIAVSGTVDGVDVAALNTAVSGLSSGSSALTNGVTATTQSASDNSTKVATTAYTDTAISNLVDSSPGTLNTLNELAAALGDDANFSTTVTNSIATKMPLSGGTFTGAVTGTTIADSKGDVRTIPLNSKSSAYTLVAGDAGKAVYISSGGVTIPASVMGAGNAVTIINDSGSNQTITQGSGLTLYNTADAATGNRTLAGRGMCTIWFAATSTAYISGAGLE